MHSLRRVKITGIGPVAPCGIGREDFASGIIESRGCVGIVETGDDDIGSYPGAQVDSGRLKEIIEPRYLKNTARHTQFAVTGAYLALKDAGIDSESFNAMQPAIYVGSSLMDIEIIQKTILFVERKGPRFALPSAVFRSSPIAIAGKICEILGFHAKIMALQSACCSGLDAIGHAALQVASGAANCVVCGGSEAPLFMHPMVELIKAGLSPESTYQPEKLGRPFDLWRTTGTIGEGAAFFVLEPEESPNPGYAWVSGYAHATDIEVNTTEGMAEAMRRALANAACEPEDINFINAWGPGHREIDRAEAQSILRVFEGSAQNVPVSSIKGAIGNPLGAAGAIQVASAALSLKSGVVPPTVNWEVPDPECPLNLSASPRAVHPRNVLVNGHGLGGSNTSLVLEKC